MKVWEAIFIALIGAALARAQAPQVTEEQRKAQEILRQKIEERQAKNPSPAAAGAQTNTNLRLTHAEMEQQYLTGKITAKQFQQYLKQQPPATSTSRMTADQQARAVEMLRALTGKTNPPPAATKTTIAKPEAPPEPANPEILGVEGKIQELEKLKEAREKANATNAPAAGAPKTKREKLDALLKQLVDGKISDAEYKAQRAKVIAEPD